MFKREEELMKNKDTRVQYTKDVLKKALLKILKIKSIDKVTVKELCDEAGINRGTFYLHYSTPNDLLLEIERDFMTENFSTFNTYMEESATNRTDTTMNNLQLLFQAVIENKELCSIIMGDHGNPHFTNRIKKAMRKDIVDTWNKEFPKYKREHLDYIFDYVFTGSMNLVLNWLNDDTPSKISIEQLANRLDKLGHYAHLAINEFI